MNDKIDDREKLIRSKVAAGLTRQQAEQVVAAQEEHDAALAEAESRKEKPKAK